MTERIVSISERPARLHFRWEQMVVESEGMPLATVPVAELGALVVSQPAVSYSQPLLIALGEAGVPLVVCDGKHLPVAMLLPLVGHHAQTQRLLRQAEAGLPLRKRLWQQIVRVKVRAQARLLVEAHGTDGGLVRLAGTVRSGDPDNVEAQAARRYWPLLFGTEFRRRRDGPDQNRHLNYGYAALRALVSQAVCAAGLHPSLGLHHHHRGNPFCLADDLMEPLRPVVDRVVLAWVRDHGREDPLDRPTREALLRPLLDRHVISGEERTLADLIQRMVQSLAAVFAGEARALTIPEV